MAFGKDWRLSGRMSGVSRISAVVWFKGHKYTQTISSPNKPFWDTFPQWNLPDDLYEKKLWGWASFIDDKPKQPRKEYKDGETIMLCARCGGFHGWLDTCPG
jgi:hypothetical protein